MFNANPSITNPLSGFYLEKKIPKESWLDLQGIKAYGVFLRKNRSDLDRYFDFAKKVKKAGKKVKNLSDLELQDCRNQIITELRRKGFRHRKSAVKAFALIREVSSRTIDMRHFDVQVVGAFVMLNGMVSEMQTGEGKTLTATLTAATVAMSGLSVHVITVNDYLAKRDAEIMSPLYSALGLTVGVIQADMTPEERKDQYQKDITYCTNNELTFDYLKDRISAGSNPSRIRVQLERLSGKKAKSSDLLLRGLHFAIIDEADSVLVDEARTPLVISSSGKSDDQQDTYNQALSLSNLLDEKDGFSVDKKERTIHLTESGKDKLVLLAEDLKGIWKIKQRREELVQQALTARLLFIKDKHYLVQDDKVQIVDEFTGRVMGDRSWEQGLHQMIEAKENVEITGQRETLARISYQRFFRKYLHLCGMTGTAKEVASELWAVYRLTTVAIPPNKKCKRRSIGGNIFRTVDQKWDAVVKKIETMHLSQRPILVGTRSVEDSEHLSQLLGDKGLEHSILNARQDKEEADIIAQAGALGKITVATNIAGRGTDIKLDTEVAGLGGLHVILTELHESKRIDRQLIGRCARQGDKGSFESLLSLEDELAVLYSTKLLRFISNSLLRSRFPFARIIGKHCICKGQRAAEKRNSIIRQDLLRADEKQDKALAFTGRIH